VSLLPHLHFYKVISQQNDKQYTTVLQSNHFAPKYNIRRTYTEFVANVYDACDDTPTIPSSVIHYDAPAVMNHFNEENVTTSLHVPVSHSAWEAATSVSKCSIHVVNY